MTSPASTEARARRLAAGDNLDAVGDDLDADPFVLHARPLRDGVDLRTTSRFSDPVWRLDAAQLQGHQTAKCLNFSTVPEPHRLAIKHLFYAMLSGDLPSGEDRAAISTLIGRMTETRRFLRWLQPRADRLADVTGVDLQDYATHLRDFMTEPNRQAARASVRHLWRYSAQIPGGGLRIDPNRLRGWGEPDRRRRPENATDRIAEEVLGPLMGWALRFVDDFADDILATWDHYDARRRLDIPRWRRHQPVKPVVDALVADYQARGRALPAFRGSLNVAFLATELRCSRDVLDRVPGLLQAAVQQLGLEDTTYDLPIRGRLDGKPWTTGIGPRVDHDFGLPRLMVHLQAACYVVIAFLSGMREAEVKHLRRGCLRVERGTDGTPYRWTVASRAFKGEDDAAGVEATWMVGEPAARAIAVLERLQPPEEDWLFAVLPVGSGAGPRSIATNTTLSVSATNDQLNSLTSWVHQYCSSRGRTDVILRRDGTPFRLTTRQFRRTLAWFIARRPGGAVAGATAFRHHAIQMFEGYAGTSDSGLRAEVEAEQALERGEHLLAMTERHEHDQLSGPAASEAARRLDEFGRTARYSGTVVTDPRRLKRLLKRYEPAVYPGPYVTCVFNPDKALCLRGRGAVSPSPRDCRPLECANVALTSENRNTWTTQVDTIDQQLSGADLLPPLVADRLRQRRESVAGFLQRHPAAAPAEGVR